MERKTTGMSANLFSLFLFILAALAMVLSWSQDEKISLRMEEQKQIEAERRISQKQSMILEETSDYLTGEVRYFIATLDVEHLWNYWTEVNENKNREKALEELFKLSLTEEEKRLILGAKAESDYLVGGETHAMRLVADSIGMETEDMPAEVAAVIYEDGEELLSPKEKQEAALSYVFGPEYSGSKDLIADNIRSFKNILTERRDRELSEAGLKTGNALMQAQLYTIAVLGLLLVCLVVFHAYAVRPMHGYAQELNGMGPEKRAYLKPSGFQETQSVAEAFNQIYKEWEQQRSQLVEERFRFQTAIESTPVIVYEYDLEEDRYSAYGNLREEDRSVRGIPLERKVEHFLSEAVDRFVGPEEGEFLRGRMKDRNYKTTEFQVFPYADSPQLAVWIRLSATPVYGRYNRVKKIIGRITDIQEEKEKELALREARAKDNLTGFYNRGSGTGRVRDYIREHKPGESYGLMLVDMDDFGTVNKLEGGVFADAILQETAEIIRFMVGPNAILTRLGGDEMMVFVKGGGRAEVTAIGGEIAARIAELSPADSSDLKISASIGMCASEVTEDYDSLYSCAESALKYVKSNGKGRAACYLDAQEKLGGSLRKAYPGTHPISDIENVSGFNREDIVAFAADLLGKSSRLDDAVYLLLARVGHLCRLDRAAILAIDMEYLTCHYEYQWAADPADIKSKEVHYVKEEELRQLASDYDENGLCTHYILQGLSDMGSVLHAGIWNCGILEGIMSFSVREKGRQWTEEEKKLLGELVGIVASHIQKAKADAVSQAKTDFLSRMSHEIRTPMNAIVGMTAIAKTVLDNPKKELECLNKIETANSYLLSLINDILDMSRIESGKVELNLTAVSLGELIDNTAGFLAVQAKEKGLCLLAANHIPKDSFCLADELRLNQILINLLGNAVKFTPAGGSITLGADMTDHKEEEMTVRFSVKDTGIGIRKESQERIFHAFEQAEKGTASSYGGTGLGLAISSRLVQMMGGTLEVESTLGQGSEFYFTLKFARAEEPSAVGSKDPGVSIDLTGKRILLVEDNEINREIAQSLLELNGITVESAEDGKKAVETFRMKPAFYYDAILMDIRMPVMGGFEASRLIRRMEKEDSRTIPIIAMTANAFDEDMKQSLENGMNGHLVKPVEVDKMMEMLGRCIAHSEKTTDNQHSREE